jgi:hypothetical protein
MQELQGLLAEFPGCRLLKALFCPVSARQARLYGNWLPLATASLKVIPEPASERISLLMSFLDCDGEFSVALEETSH